MSMNDTQYVYFVRTGKYLKIGISRYVEKRLKAMQIGNSKRMILIGVIEGSNALEKSLHKKFERFKTRGEWFHYTPELKAAVAELIAPAEPMLSIEERVRKYTSHIYAVPKMSKYI
jgi:hypothetical protein